MNKKLFWLTVLFFIFSFFLLNLFEPVSARPGGGHGFSSGGSGSRGFGSSGGKYRSQKIYIRGLEKSVDVELIKLILALIIGGSILYLKIREADKGQLLSVSSLKTNPKQSIDEQVEAFKQKDPDFSLTLFLDFASNLYLEFYNCHGRDEIINLIPYISEKELRKASNKMIRIEEVVIGSISLYSILEKNDYDIINTDIYSNYTVTTDLEKTKYELFERWQFCRKKGVSSKNPETMRQLSCPSCGVEHKFIAISKCENCGVDIKPGEIQWFLNNKNVLVKEKFESSVSHVQEIGTDFKTIFQKNIQEKITVFCHKNKITEWDKYLSHLKKEIISRSFLEIYENWSKNQLEPIRFLLSENLYRSFGFWVKIYRGKQLFNKLENIQIEQIELVKIDLDKYYDSITVRIFAHCYDFLQSSSGIVVSGSRTDLRSFSEYWTFIRKSGLEKEVIIIGENCPSCGSDLPKNGQSTKCDKCGSTINNGDFSWVLTMITQDEVYRG